MLKFYLFACIFLLLTQISFASIDDIETSLQACLNKSNGSLEMSYCTEEASSIIDLEIRQILLDNSNNIELRENQRLWKEYKNSVDVAVTSPLLKALGWDYVLFAKNNIYVLNLNRLKLLSYLFQNKSYANKNKTTIEKTLQNINNYTTNLSKKMAKEEYQNVLKNQSSWEKYKNHTNKLLNKYDNLQKHEFLKDLYSERALQLWSLDFIYNLPK